ncbi:MAG: cycloisomerase, partial [Verrucomicrobiae bacterium]|nr:cycloisomerase [Verrucomicrobiae bacterium]
MIRSFVLILIAGSLFSTLARAERMHYEIKRFNAPEAKQGVAVDDEFAYVVSNFAIGKYRKSDGVRVASWECPEGDPLTHMNDGFVYEGKLYASHSNYPGVPSTSSVEIFDTKDL